MTGASLTSGSSRRLVFEPSLLSRNQVDEISFLVDQLPLSQRAVAQHHIDAPAAAHGQTSAGIAAPARRFRAELPLALGMRARLLHHHSRSSAEDSCPHHTKRSDRLQKSCVPQKLAGVMNFIMRLTARATLQLS